MKSKNNKILLILFFVSIISLSSVNAFDDPFCAYNEACTTMPGYMAWEDTSPCGESGTVDCLYPDVNNDEIINILDIILAVNVVLGGIEPTPYYWCAVDGNIQGGDGVLNILDVVAAMNVILGGGESYENVYDYAACSGTCCVVESYGLEIHPECEDGSDNDGDGQPDGLDLKSCPPGGFRDSHERFDCGLSWFLPSLGGGARCLTKSEGTDMGAAAELCQPCHNKCRIVYNDYYALIDDGDEWLDPAETCSVSLQSPDGTGPMDLTAFHWGTDGVNSFCSASSGKFYTLADNSWHDGGDSGVMDIIGDLTAYSSENAYGVACYDLNEVYHTVGTTVADTTRPGDVDYYDELEWARDYSGVNFGGGGSDTSWHDAGYIEDSCSKLPGDGNYYSRRLCAYCGDGLIDSSETTIESEAWNGRHCDDPEFVVPLGALPGEYKCYCDDDYQPLPNDGLCYGQINDNGTIWGETDTGVSPFGEDWGTCSGYGSDQSTCLANAACYWDEDISICTGYNNGCTAYDSVCTRGKCVSGQCTYYNVEETIEDWASNCCEDIGCTAGQYCNGDGACDGTPVDNMCGDGECNSGEFIAESPVNCPEDCAPGGDRGWSWVDGNVVSDYIDGDCDLGDDGRFNLYLDASDAPTNDLDQHGAIGFFCHEFCENPGGWDGCDWYDGFMLLGPNWETDGALGDAVSWASNINNFYAGLTDDLVTQSNDDSNSNGDGYAGNSWVAPSTTPSPGSGTDQSNLITGLLSNIVDNGAGYFITWIYSDADYTKSILVDVDDDLIAAVFGGYGTCVYTPGDETGSCDFVPDNAAVNTEWLQDGVISDQSRTLSLVEGWNVIFFALGDKSGAETLHYMDIGQLFKDDPHVIMMDSLGPTNPWEWQQGRNRGGEFTYEERLDMIVPPTGYIPEVKLNTDSGRVFKFSDGIGRPKKETQDISSIVAGGKEVQISETKRAPEAERKWWQIWKPIILK